MTEPTRVQRTVDTDMAPDELWALVSDGDAWAAWMVDEADVAVTPGAGGHIVDDGVARVVRIDGLDDDGTRRSVDFTWWPHDRPDLASAVELVVVPAVTGSRLGVTETTASARACGGTAPLMWDVRLMRLVAQALNARV